MSAALAGDRLLQLARQFREKRLEAEEFASAYIAQWRRDRDSAVVRDELATEVLDDIFCDCDAFDPLEDRAQTSIDGTELRRCVGLRLARLDEVTR